MYQFPEGIGKFEMSESPVKPESQRDTSSGTNSSSVKTETQRNTSSDPILGVVKSETQRNTSADPILRVVKSEAQRNTSSETNSSSVKSETQRNTSSDPILGVVKSEAQRNTSSDPSLISLPSRLCECKCKVVVVQDLLQCGVVQLEGANRKAYCLFFRKDFLGRNDLDHKLSTLVPVGTILLANARLMKARSVIPFLATSIWEDGAIPGENELSKLFSSLESQEIEQYNMFTRDLEWFLPKDDCVKNNIDKDMAADSKLDFNKNSTANCQGLSRNRSRQKRSTSPGHHSQIESKSTCLQTEDRSQAKVKSSRKRPSRTRSRSPCYPSRSRSPVRPTYCQKARGKRSRSRSSPQARGKRSSSRPSRPGSRSPRSCWQTKSRNRSPSYQNIQAKGSKHRRSRTRSRSPRDHFGSTKSKYPRTNQEQTRRESVVTETKRKRDLTVPSLRGDSGNKDKTDKRSILNIKGKVVRILNSNYGIALVLGFGRVSRVLFDIFDVWMEGHVCADLGKTLHDVMQEGDLVCLNAIKIDNAPMSSTGQRIEYLATAVLRASNVEALLSTKRFLPFGNPSSLDEVSEDKIKNFHQVAKVVLATQDGGSSFEEAIHEKNEIPLDIGILWNRRGTGGQHVDFFCFHCKHCHYRTGNNTKKASEDWEAHNKHVITCKNLKCLERGKDIFHSWKQKLELKTPQNLKTEKEEVLQEREFKRLKHRGNAAKSDLNQLYCFHCQYEGESMSHFTSKKHQDHLQDCGTKILDCPENPEISSAVYQLICRREMLHLHQEKISMHLHQENISSSHHRYFCLHCKEPFSDKRHIQGVNHTLHMAKDSCDPTCKFVLLDDEKYVSGCGKGGKWCFICNVKLESKIIYKAHIKDSRHAHNVFNLLKKKEHPD